MSLKDKLTKSSQTAPYTSNKLKQNTETKDNSIKGTIEKQQNNPIEENINSQIPEAEEVLETITESNIEGEKVPKKINRRSTTRAKNKEISKSNKKDKTKLALSFLIIISTITNIVFLYIS